ATRAFALERKVCFVFSDSVDYNLGGYTKDELDQMLAASALPIYALGFDTGDKTALDNFGALARTSGGVIHIVSESTVSDALQQMAAETKNVFVAELHAASNVIKGSPLPFVLTDQASGVQQQKQVPVRFYVPDNEAPQVLRAEQLTDESIRIYFNIPVQGAGSGESYTVQAESGDLLGIRAAAYDGSGRFATLTFTDKPATGMLTIRFPGITDISMEKNGIETALTLDFRAQVLPPEDEGIPIYLWFIIPIVCITLIAIVAIVATRRRAAGKAAMAESETPYARPAAEDGTAVVRLHITNLQGESRSVVLPAGKPIFVGRRAANDLVIDDSSLADQQFVIDHTHGTGYVLTNLSKTDETLVNDAPISTSHVLKDGDIIVAGRQVIVFHTKP
ncbi:MAG: FHA domain-containing protein, partial [Oscillospiraceae bacterium]